MVSVWFLCVLRFCFQKDTREENLFCFLSRTGWLAPFYTHRAVTGFVVALGFCMRNCAYMYTYIEKPRWLWYLFSLGFGTKGTLFTIDVKRHWNATKPGYFKLDCLQNSMMRDWRCVGYSLYTTGKRWASWYRPNMHDSLYFCLSRASGSIIGVNFIYVFFETMSLLVQLEDDNWLKFVSLFSIIKRSLPFSLCLIGSSWFFRAPSKMH